MTGFRMLTKIEEATATTEPALGLHSTAPMSVMNSFAVGILLVQSVAVAVETLGHANLRSDHDAAVNYERRAQDGDDFWIYYCVYPEGKLSENWLINPDSPSGESCVRANTDRICCGPLQNIYGCPEGYYAWPGSWPNGVCKGYSANNCCYFEDGYTQWDFPTCFDPDVKILNNWVGDTCTAYYYWDCCAESLAASSSAPTVAPPVYSGSRGAPTSPPVSQPVYQPVDRPVYQPVSSNSSSSSSDSPSSDTNGAMTGGFIAGIIMFVIAIALLCYARVLKKKSANGTTNPNLPEKKTTSSQTKESTTESERQVEQLAVKIQESIDNSGGAGLTVEQLSALIKESIPNAGAAVGREEGGRIRLLATLARAISALSGATNTVENITASINSIAGIASLFQE